jgi:hypothetical protein
MIDYNINTQEEFDNKMNAFKKSFASNDIIEDAISTLNSKFPMFANKDSMSDVLLSIEKGRADVSDFFT